MNKAFQNRWFGLLHELPDEKLSASELLSVLLNFLRNCSLALDEEPFFLYGLNQFSTLHAEDYPVEFTSSSDAEVRHMIAVLKRNETSSARSIAQLLRDTLEQLLVVEFDRDCPRCASNGMGIFKNHSDDRVALLCKQCGWQSILTIHA
jgi:RNase P subunit RPR2